jgi:hypothetical protein
VVAAEEPIEVSPLIQDLVVAVEELLTEHLQADREDHTDIQEVQDHKVLAEDLEDLEVVELQHLVEQVLQVQLMVHITAAAVELEDGVKILQELAETAVAETVDQKDHNKMAELIEAVAAVEPDPEEQLNQEVLE